LDHDRHEKGERHERDGLLSRLSGEDHFGRFRFVDSKAVTRKDSGPAGEMLSIDDTRELL
jgi:hypothetical protein